MPRFAEVWSGSLGEVGAEPGLLIHDGVSASLAIDQAGVAQGCEVLRDRAWC